MLLAAAGVAGYTHDEIVDAHQFSARVASSLHDHDVRAAIATRTIDSLATGVAPQVLVVRPLLTSALIALTGTDAFADVLRRAIADQHDALFTSRSARSIDLEYAGALLAPVVGRLSPAAAARLPADVAPVLVPLDQQAAPVRVAHAVDRLAGWFWPLVALALLAGAGAAALAGGARAAFGTLAASLLGGGLVVAVALVVTRAIVLANLPSAASDPTRGAARALWSALFSDLLVGALVAAAVGLAAVIGVAAVQARHGRAWRPLAARLGIIIAVVLAGTAGAITVALPATGTLPPSPVVVPGACNGSVALCGRRLDQVVFPSTHNSFAAADEPGWLFPNQRFGIARQLRDGIRGLLIDIHYGQRDPKTGRVRTDLAAEGSDRNKVAQELGPGALRQADLLAGRVGRPLPTGRRGVYLCHTLCELGSEPLEGQLRIIGQFLDANPREVLVIFVEPYVPVGAIEQALRRTNLLSEAAELRLDEPLPTLRTLIRAQTRLVILAEEDGGTRPWYLDGFAFAQDTPYRGVSRTNLPCTRFRGRANSPLFLLNHWIDAFPPPPARNAEIGGAVLRDRVARCEQERRRLPNLLAVDFYERSDVVTIARERNAQR